MDEQFDEELELRQQISNLTAVREMTAMPGWKIICKHFSEVIKAVQDQLCQEEDFKKIKRLQERLRSFRAMLETVDSLCSEEAKQRDQLDNIVAHNNERDQYGQP